MSNIDQLVQARKRRRRAIDPSIGYYIYSECTLESSGTKCGDVADIPQELEIALVDERATTFSPLSGSPMAR